MGQTRGYLAQDLFSNSTRCLGENTRVHRTLWEYTHSNWQVGAQSPLELCVLQHMLDFSFVNLSNHSSDPHELLGISTLGRIVFHSLLMHCVNS